jgi:hypothetical protein
MKWKISKILFPGVSRDLRKKKMKNLLFWFLVALAIGLIVGAGIYYENR